MPRMRNRNQDISDKEKSTIFASKDSRKEIEQSDSIKCEICSKVYKNKESFFNHNVSAHGQVTKLCYLCKLCFETEPELITHNLVFHDTNLIICGLGKCLLQFETHDKFVVHLKEKLEARKMSFCDVCNAKFRKKRALLTHKINEHKLGKVYICSQCDYFYAGSLDDLMAHEKREVNHNQYTLPTTQPHASFDGNIVYCKACDKTFDFATSLIRHIKFTHGEILDTPKPEATVNEEQRPEDSKVGTSKFKCNNCEKKQNLGIRKQHLGMCRLCRKYGIKKPRHKEDGNEVAETKIEIKIEIKLEPCDNGDGQVRETEFNLEETYKDPVNHPSDEDYTIKQEYFEDNFLKIPDYDIKVEESDNHISTNGYNDNPVEKSQKLFVGGLKKASSEDLLNYFKKFGEVDELEMIQQEHENVPVSAYVTFKEESGLVAAVSTTHKVLDKTVVCKRASIKPGKIIVNLPYKLSDMPDDVIKEFFETSYGKIIEFERGRRGKKQLKSFCWITFEDEKASKYLEKQEHVFFEGLKLDTSSFKAQSYPQTNTPLLNSKPDDMFSKKETPKPPVESDNDSVSSMLVQYNQRPIPRPMKKLKGISKNVQNPALVQYPAMAQNQAMPPTQYPAMPPTQYPAMPPTQYQAMPTTRYPAMPPTRYPAMPPTRYSVMPPTKYQAIPPTQYQAIPLTQYQAIPPTQYPAMPPTPYPRMTQYGYGYQPQPYGCSWDPCGIGFYPNQFGYNYWAQSVNKVNSPYCYYDGAGKLVERRIGRNARMWPY